MTATKALPTRQATAVLSAFALVACVVAAACSQSQGPAGDPPTTPTAATVVATGPPAGAATDPAGGTPADPVAAAATAGTSEVMPAGPGDLDAELPLAAALPHVGRRGPP